jgi:hypothetical protein
LSQQTLTGETPLEARKNYSVSLIPNKRVYCLFCFYIGYMREFAQIGFQGELEKYYRCPHCHTQMERETLMNNFDASKLGEFVARYDFFWNKIQDHDRWVEGFKKMFSYEDRMRFWNAYYTIRPKKEKTVEDSL